MEICTVCNREFVQKKYLNQHMKIHDKHKPFQCSVCPKRFLRKQHKNRHERVHTVMAPGQRRITWTPRSSAPATEGPSVPGPSTAQPQPTGGAIGPLRKRHNQEPDLLRQRHRRRWVHKVPLGVRGYIRLERRLGTRQLLGSWFVRNTWVVRLQKCWM